MDLLRPTALLHAEHDRRRLRYATCSTATKPMRDLSISLRPRACRTGSQASRAHVEVADGARHGSLGGGCPDASGLWLSPSAPAFEIAQSENDAHIVPATGTCWRWKSSVASCQCVKVPPVKSRPSSMRDDLSFSSCEMRPRHACRVERHCCPLGIHWGPSFVGCAGRGVHEHVARCD